jgi:hypothetical protein
MPRPGFPADGVAASPSLHPDSETCAVTVRLGLFYYNLSAPFGWSIILEGNIRPTA